ncbi:unnamed protein product [Arctia plantaginis]|uniref:Peptidase aspartic putative domain-containing protein n=1 Tax=Arctia plantaginis TaxID=874455 RepID=A0A8S1AW89_ARCPL|nr:unnamed protein product [Arctia plantaginis]
MGNTESLQTRQPGVVLHTNMEKNGDEETDVTMMASHISTKQSTILLATALVQVTTDDNYEVTLRALIDQGSQASFISESAAQLLKVKRYPMKGLPGSPCAYRTKFIGKIEDKTEPDSMLVMHHNIDLEDFLKTLWEIDQVQERKYTKEEQKCEKFYEETYQRDSNGRYIVRLPFVTRQPASPNGNFYEAFDPTREKITTNTRA